MPINNDNEHGKSYYNRDRGISQYIDWRSDLPKMTKSVSEFTRNKSVEGVIIPRNRINQPEGFKKPIYNYYAEKHNYRYYTEDWEHEGKSYKRGYYDENGVYYKKIAFEQNGIFSNVNYVCAYCGNSSKMDWRTGQTLKCPKCGGGISIETPCDTYTQDPEYTYFKEFVEPQYAERTDDPKEMYIKLKSFYEDESKPMISEDGLTYRNIVCKCRYCDNTTKSDWKIGDMLSCPKCGGKMDILSPLDMLEKTYERQDNKEKMTLREKIEATVLILIIIASFIFIIIRAAS